MKLTCYVCGEEVSTAYFEILARESTVTDRVFICCYNCIDQIEDKCYHKKAIIRD